MALCILAGIFCVSRHGPGPSSSHKQHLKCKPFSNGNTVLVLMILFFGKRGRLSKVLRACLPNGRKSFPLFFLSMSGLFIRTKSKTTPFYTSRNSLIIFVSGSINTLTFATRKKNKGKNRIFSQGDVCINQGMCVILKSVYHSVKREPRLPQRATIESIASGNNNCCNKAKLIQIISSKYNTICIATVHLQPGIRS